MYNGMKPKRLIGVRLSEEQLAFLRDEAARLGISLADFLRRIIDRYRDTEGPS